MKSILKTLILIILSLMTVPGISQVQSQFQGTINIFASSEISAYRYSITGFFNDLNGKYTSDQLVIGDVVYAIEGATCIRFSVDSIVSNMGGIITAYVVDTDSISTVPPSGVSALMREGPNRQYPTYIPGINANLQSCILSHFALEVDEDLANVAASGVTITQTDHGFSLWQPIYWQDTMYAVPPQDTNVAIYVVVDSIDANTFKAASYGSFATDLPEGAYYQNGGTYSLVADTVQVPLFVVANGELVINGFTGFDFSPGTSTWLKTELEAGTPVAIAADTTTFDITGLERARLIANRVGDYTYSSRMYNTNTPNAGMYVTNSRNGTVNRIEIDTMKTRLVAYSTDASTELAFYQDSLTLQMTSDTPQVGQVLGVHSIADDGITANLKFQDVGGFFINSNIRYVAPNGNDATAVPGDQTKPYQSITGATTGLSGTTKTLIYLKTGSYDITSNLFPVDSLVYYSEAGTTLNVSASSFSSGSVNYARIYGNPNLVDKSSVIPIFYIINSTEYTDFSFELGDVFLEKNSTLTTLTGLIKNYSVSVENIFASDYEQIYQMNGAIQGKDTLEVGVINFKTKNAFLNYKGTDGLNRSFLANASMPLYIEYTSICDNIVMKGTNNSHAIIYESPRSAAGATYSNPTSSRLNYVFGNVKYSGVVGAFILQVNDTLVDYHMDLMVKNAKVEKNSSGTIYQLIQAENITHRPNTKSTANIHIGNAYSDQTLVTLSNSDTTYITTLSGNFTVGSNNPVVSIGGAVKNGLILKDCFLKNDGSVPVISGPANSTVRVAGVYGDSELLDTDINFVRFEYGDNNASLSRDAGVDLTIPSITGYSVPFSSNNYTSSNYTVAGDSAFTVQSAGVYEITFSGNLQVTSGTAQTTSVDIYRNAAVVGATSTCYISTSPTHFSTTKIVSLSKGDVIKLKIPPTDWAGSTVKVLYGSNFIIKRIQ